MRRIMLGLPTILSLTAAPLAAQEPDCAGWMQADYEGMERFWKTASLETVSDCLKAGADVNARSQDGVTPLVIAIVYTKNPEIFTMLLNAGANVNSRNMAGLTPLHMAAIFEQPETLIALINAGASVNARDSIGLTPLHFLARNGNVEALIMLYEAGADLNAKDITGDTPLHWAAEHNNKPEVITMLLELGADGRHRNDDGNTAYDLAHNNSHLKGTEAYWALHDAQFD